MPYPPVDVKIFDLLLAQDEKDTFTTSNGFLFVFFSLEFVILDELELPTVHVRVIIQALKSLQAQI